MQILGVALSGKIGAANTLSLSTIWNSLTTTADQTNSNNWGGQSLKFGVKVFP